MKEIIGHGDIAKTLAKTEKDVLFFASGVSNSQETRESEYQREKDLLLSQRRDMRLVYFSSLRVFMSDDRYTRHKMEMEQLIKDNFPKYCIIRLGNIDWGTNPHTLINFFRNQLKMGLPLNIQDTSRHIISKGEFLYWIDLIPDWNCEMNMPGRMMKVKDIVKEYVL